jgi:hypothetical protein
MFMSNTSLTRREPRRPRDNRSLSLALDSCGTKKGPVQAGPSLYERFADLGAKALGEKLLPFSAKSIESNIPIWSLTDPYGDYDADFIVGRIQPVQ